MVIFTPIRMIPVEMLEIKGIGENRVSLYGDYMIAGLNSVIIDDNEESRQSDASDM